MRYAIINEGFFTGSLADTPPYTRLVFLAMLLWRDEQGIFRGCPSFLARVLNIDVAQVEESLRILSSPDPSSTALVEGGRRIKPVDGFQNTWLIINAKRYDEIASAGKKRARDRVRSRSTYSALKSPASDVPAGLVEALKLFGKEKHPSNAELVAWNCLIKRGQESGKWDEAKILEVIRWARQDEFWKVNCLALTPLAKRKQAGDVIKFEKVFNAYLAQRRADGPSSRILPSAPRAGS